MIVRATVLLVFLIGSLPSLSMQTMPFVHGNLYKKTHRIQFFLQAPPVQLLLQDTPMYVTLPEETQLKIFSLTSPKIKNYWCMANKHWQNIGSKYKPNVYNLIKFYSPICAHADDITFMLFNAAFDGNIEITEQILHGNGAHNFFYEFPYQYVWHFNIGVEFRYFDVQDIIRDQKNVLKIALKEHNEEDLCEKLVRNKQINMLLLKYIDQDKRRVKKYGRLTHPCTTYDIMMTAYKGEVSFINPIVSVSDDVSIFSADRINFSLCIAIHKNNKGMIPILLDCIRENKEGSQACYNSMRFFDLAAIYKRKKIFEMLIASDVYKLNRIYNAFELMLIDSNVTTLKHSFCSKFTYLDLMEYHARMYPNKKLDEYVLLIKKHGGKRAKEIIKQ